MEQLSFGQVAPILCMSLGNEQSKFPFPFHSQIENELPKKPYSTPELQNASFTLEWWKN